MKVLVIPDVHLKPRMFEAAAKLLRRKVAEEAVCLMDLPDDWNQQMNVDLYIQTFDAAIRFAREFPETRWCYGNHDLSYQWREEESGYSTFASWTVQKKLIDLKAALPEDNPIQYIHRIDHVLFSHGGLSAGFVKAFGPAARSSESMDSIHTRYEDDDMDEHEDIDRVLYTINQLGREDMWNDMSPIWCRPQLQDIKMYRPDQYLQVVGHTPVDHITRKWNRHQNTISCDTFSTYRDGKPIGAHTFVVVDTENWSFEECDMQ